MARRRQAPLPLLPVASCLITFCLVLLIRVFVMPVPAEREAAAATTMYSVPDDYWDDDLLVPAPAAPPRRLTPLACLLPRCRAG